jgi:hypothetical protein
MPHRTSSTRHRPAPLGPGTPPIAPSAARQADGPTTTGAPGTRRARPARVLGSALVLVLLAGLGACGDDDADTGSDTTVATEIGDAASVESSTTAPETTVAETPAAPVGAPDPEAAAASLYGAWKAGDRAAAATVAEPVAVDAVFAAAPGDYALYNRCSTGEFGSSGCLYRGDPGTIQFSMTQREAAWVVTMAVFSPA